MYTEHRPCTLLSPYIDKYWEFKGNPEQGTRINILPDGCTDFIFTLGDSPQTLNGNLTMRPFHTYFIGPMTGYSELITYTKTVHMLGIRFRPYGIFRFWNCLYTNSPIKGFMPEISTLSSTIHGHSNYPNNKSP